MNQIQRVTPLCLSLGVFLCLNGCASMAPKYTQPAAPVPTAWENLPAVAGEAVKPVQKPLAEIPWREFFVDEHLRTLIALALENSRDLQVAALNIERFRALYQIQSAELLPKVEVSTGATVQRIPESLSGTGHARTTQQYTVGAGLISYELDMFGRVQSLKDQALEQYLATDQARRSVQISLVSQVATAYLAFAADRERLKLATETLASQQESLQLIQRRSEAGVSSLLEVQQARISVETARVDIARYTSIVAQDANALTVLIGSPVPAGLLPETLSATVAPLNEVPAGLTSDVLLRRPDIIQAEGQLKGANANIGAARAAFFPRITLVSSVGFGSDELSGLFKAGSFAWSFAPRISLPIFDGGSSKANLKVAEVDRDIMVARYEKAIQTAFREVADVLAQRGTIDEQVAAQQALTDTTSERYRLSQARFNGGVDSHLNVLDSQRSLYGAQQNLIGTRLLRLVTMISLYKVLGGGGE